MSQATEALEQEPVFVDPSGRRRRFARATGIIAGCIIAAYAVVIVFGLITNTRIPLTPWPSAGAPHRADAPGQGLRLRVGRPVPSPDHVGMVAPQQPRPTTRPVTRTPSHAGTKPTATPIPTTAPTTASTHPNNGHAYGRTKSPNPKKP